MIKTIFSFLMVFGLGLASATQGYSQVKPTPRDTSVVSVLFGADIYSSIEDYSTQPTLAVATVGINFFRNGWDASLRAVLLSNQNTISDDRNKVYGRVLLTEGFTSSGFRGLKLDVSSPYFSDLLKNKRSGFLRRFRANAYLYSGASNWNWTADDVVNPNPNFAANRNAYEALLFSGGLNGSYTMQTIFNQDNSLTLTFHAGLTTRFIAGQLSTSGPGGEIEEVRNQTLKTDNRAFAGLEFGATLRFNWVYARVNMTYFGGDTQGFSGLKDVVSAGILTDIHMTKARKWYPVKTKTKITKRGSSMKR